MVTNFYQIKSDYSGSSFAWLQQNLGKPEHPLGRLILKRMPIK